MKSYYSILIHKKDGWDIVPPITAKPVALNEKGYELIDTQGHSTADWVTLLGRYIDSSDLSNTTSFLAKTEQDKASFESAEVHNVGGISKLKDFSFTMERTDLDLIAMLGCLVDLVEWNGSTSIVRFSGKIQRINTAIRGKVEYGCEGILANAELFIRPKSSLLLGASVTDYVELDKLEDKIDEAGLQLIYDSDLYNLNGLAIASGKVDSDDDEIFIDIVSPYTTDGDNILFEGQGAGLVIPNFTTKDRIYAEMPAYVALEFLGANVVVPSDGAWLFQSDTEWGGVYYEVSREETGYLSNYKTVIVFKTTLWGAEPSVVSKIVSNGHLYNTVHGYFYDLVAGNVVSSPAITNSDNMQDRDSSNYWEMFSKDTFGMQFSLLNLWSDSTGLVVDGKTYPIIAVQPLAGFNLGISILGTFDIPPLVGEQLSWVNQHYADNLYIRVQYDTIFGSLLKCNNFTSHTVLSEDKSKLNISMETYSSDYADFEVAFVLENTRLDVDFLYCDLALVASTAVQISGNLPYTITTSLEYSYGLERVELVRNLVGESALDLRSLLERIKLIDDVQSISDFGTVGHYKITHRVTLDSAQPSPVKIGIALSYDGFKAQIGGAFDLASETVYGNLSYRTAVGGDLLLDSVAVNQNPNTDLLYRLIPQSGDVVHREEASIVFAELPKTSVAGPYKLTSVGVLGEKLDVHEYVQNTSNGQGFGCVSIKIAPTDEYGRSIAEALILSTEASSPTHQASHGYRQNGGSWFWNTLPLAGSGVATPYAYQGLVVEIDPLRRFYIKYSNGFYELWRREGVIQGMPHNPVLVIQRLLVDFAQIPPSRLDTASFTLARDKTQGQVCSYVVDEDTLVNKIIDTISKDFGLIVFETDDGLVSIVHLFPPEETLVTKTILKSDILFNGLAYNIVEKFTSLTYLISEMDVEWGKDKQIDSATLDQTPFVVARSYLGGVEYSVRLMLLSVGDEATARECARLKQLFHFEPVRLVELDINHLYEGIQLGTWLKIDPTTLPFSQGKIYVVMKIRRGKDKLSLDLYEFNWNTLHLAIQEVPISANNNFDEQDTAVEQIEEKPNA